MQYFTRSKSQFLLTVMAVAVVGVLAMGAPAHARPTPPTQDAPEVGGPVESTPEPEDGGDATPEAGPGPGPRPPAENAPDVDEPTATDYPQNPESPFDVILEVAVAEPGATVVNGRLDLVELQAATDREPTFVTVKWSDGKESGYDLSEFENTSFNLTHEYERPVENRTYTVIAWVEDNEGGIGIDSQDVTIEALYDVTLGPISFSPWGAGDYDCDGMFRGEGDFTFGYRLNWAEVRIENEQDFDLGAGETKRLLRDGVTVRGVSESAFAQLQYWWSEDDGWLQGWPLQPASFDTSAPGPRFIDLKPRPDQTPFVFDVVEERDGCEMHIVAEIVTRPAA